MPRLRIERRMQGNEIGLTQKIVERQMGEPRFAFLAFGLAPGSPVKHAHGETVRAARHRLAYQPAAANEADRSAVHDGPEQVARLAAGKFSGTHKPVTLHHAPR